MAPAATSVINKPAWIDLSTTDPAAARAFYSTVFGWDIDVNQDPQYGGYALARSNGHDVAGIGGTQSPDQPAAWMLYIGTDDAEALGAKVQAAGGTVAAPAFDVGDQGRMAVFQDPAGAFISGWQATRMGGFGPGAPNSFGWAEVNARGVDKVLPFYQEVFGWTPRTTGSPDQPYTEFQIDGKSIAGATEMNPEAPAAMPSYWLVYFAVKDVDAVHRAAVTAGGRELLAPLDFPGGRMSMVSDPQGAPFGLLTMADS